MSKLLVKGKFNPKYHVVWLPRLNNIFIAWFYQYFDHGDTSSLKFEPVFSMKNIQNITDDDDVYLVENVRSRSWRHLEGRHGIEVHQVIQAWLALRKIISVRSSLRNHSKE